MFIVCSWCPKQSNAKNKKRVTRTAINRWLAAFSCTSIAQSHGIISETLEICWRSCFYRPKSSNSQPSSRLLLELRSRPTRLESAATKEKRKPSDRYRINCICVVLIPLHFINLIRISFSSDVEPRTNNVPGHSRCMQSDLSFSASSCPPCKLLF